MVRANGVDICIELFGDPSEPAVVLIMGSSAAMDWWEDEFCRRIAAGGRFVLRFDHRDTGQSTTYPPGAPEYTLGDMAEDVVGVLDVLGIGRAHLVAMSMGGAIAQLIALDHPDRVASLTLIGSAPAAPGPDDPDLEPMSDGDMARFGALRAPDWSDRDAVIDYGVELARVSAATSHPFDDAALRELWGRVFDRTRNIESTMTNHSVIDFGGRIRERLAGLEMPTLVIHGTEDPVVPYANGEVLAREIPGAELLTLEGAGHELPERVWDVVVPALLRHTDGAQ
jgi:pimeloyl-ACP methyl ester carboxylesterase